jgi:hypothetical protein
LKESFFFADPVQGMEAGFATLAEQAGVLDGQGVAGMGQAARVRLAFEDGGFGSVGAGGGWLSGSWHANGDRQVCPSDHSVFDGRTPTGAVLG